MAIIKKKELRTMGQEDMKAKLVDLRKEVYLSMENGSSFSESKSLFNQVVSLYENRIKQKIGKDDK